eukprot:3361879-Heterocapsa_arctica.AAC.1
MYRDALDAARAATREYSRESNHADPHAPDPRQAVRGSNPGDSSAIEPAFVRLARGAIPQTQRTCRRRLGERS